MSNNDEIKFHMKAKNTHHVCKSSLLHVRARLYTRIFDLYKRNIQHCSLSLRNILRNKIERKWNGILNIENRKFVLFLISKKKSLFKKICNLEESSSVRTNLHIRKVSFIIMQLHDENR